MDISLLYLHGNTAQKMKFSIKNFFSKCDQIRSLLRIWSHLLKKALMENFILLCSVVHIRYPIPIKVMYSLKTLQIKLHNTLKNPQKNKKVLKSKYK